MRIQYLIACIIFCATSLVANAKEVELIALTDLRSKYADQNSDYVTIDGSEIHFKDEGDGPAVLLLHASFFNLKAWDQLAAHLRTNHRVVRMDFPHVGLSGPETKEPTGGRFNVTERNYEVVKQFVEERGLKTFDLIATSSGATVGFRYAARHADRINRLILINSAGMPRTRQTNPNRERADLAEWSIMPIKPREYWDYTINRNFPSEMEAPAEFVDLAFDLNRRSDMPSASRYIFDTGNPKSIFSKITAPTMILWGEDNPTVMHLEADVIEHWMTSAPTFIKKYVGLGHYPYIEAPDLVNRDIADFLTGQKDTHLRVTQRVAPR